MNALFRISAAAVFILVLAGCKSQPEWHPANQVLVINALTEVGEADVLIAFTDTRTWKTTYGKTDEKGEAWLDIPQSDWGSMKLNKFSYELGKPGFDMPLPCGIIISSGEEAERIFCIAPAGTDRSKLPNHNHAPSRHTQSQSTLREEWETFKYNRPKP